MKKTIFTFALFCLGSIAVANDLTFIVVNSTSGANGSVDLTVAGGITPYTYAWTGPSGFNSSSQDISGLYPGTYNVTVTDKYCGVATYAVVVDNATDINETSGALSLTIFPNPSDNRIEVATGADLSQATFKLINIAGQVVMEKTDLNGSNFTFDVSDQAAGVYFVEINNDGVFSRTRFMKN